MAETISDKIQEQVNSMKRIPLISPQDFFNEKINKVKVAFKHEEDMLVLLLSIFVHDFAHDYNFSDTMIQRILANVTELESMGLTLNNSVLKYYKNKFEPLREVNMYDDSKIVDIQPLDQPLDQPLEKVEPNNEPLGKVEPNNQPLEKVEPNNQPLEKVEPNNQPFLKVEPNNNETTVENMVEPNNDDINDKNMVEPNEALVEDPLAVNENSTQLTGGDINQDNETNIVVDIPKDILSSANYEQIIQYCLQSGDFLTMVTALKTYIISFLDTYSIVPNFKDDFDKIQKEDNSFLCFYNLSMYNNIQSTALFIIKYLEEEELMLDDEEDDKQNTIFIRSLVAILLDSFIQESKLLNSDYSKDSIEILDSNEVLEQFIINFVKLCSISDIKEFSTNEQKGGSLPLDLPLEKVEPNKETNDEASEVPNQVVTAEASEVPNKETNVEATELPNEDTNVEASKVPNKETNEAASEVPNQDTNVESAELPNEGVAAEASKVPNEVAISEPEPESIIEDNTRLAEPIPLEVEALPQEVEDKQSQVEPEKVEDVLVPLTQDTAVFHNNLLTTITRGMFLKLGIWQSIFKKLKELGIWNEAEEYPDFTNESIKFLSFDYLKNVYPIDKDIGNINNELLISQIIILKPMLVEVKPDIVLLAKGIDDKLKSYMDSFYLHLFKNEPMVGGLEVNEEPMLKEISPEEIEKACDINQQIIKRLQNTPIKETSGINNLFELLKSNTTTAKMIDEPNVTISVPKYKFIIDNASRLSSNINGLNLYESISKPIGDKCDYFFGLYQNLHRGVFCPGSSIMDAMDNCSMKYNATEPKEIGTTNFELSYEGSNKLTYGGTVLYYNDDTRDQTNVNIDFRLSINGDVTIINTNNISVADADNLKARIVYKSVIQTIKQLFLKNYGISMEDLTSFKAVYSVENDATNWLLEKMKRMWTMLQFKQNPDNFNLLLGSTALKNMGDFLQECQGTLQWGGYINAFDEMVDTTNEFIVRHTATPIMRSVSKENAIIPYNEKGNALRLCVQGDRPSGFRSIYMLLNATTGINEHAITGYLMKQKSLLVARGKGTGTIIYVDNNPKNVKQDRFTVSLDTKEKVTKKGSKKQEPIVEEAELVSTDNLIPNANDNNPLQEKGGKKKRNPKTDLKINTSIKKNSKKKHKITNKQFKIKVKKRTIKKR